MLVELVFSELAPGEKNVHVFSEEESYFKPALLYLKWKAVFISAIISGEGGKKNQQRGLPHMLCLP